MSEGKGGGGGNGAQVCTSKMWDVHEGRCPYLGTLSAMAPKRLPIFYLDYSIVCYEHKDI